MLNTETSPVEQVSVQRSTWVGERKERGIIGERWNLGRERVWFLRSDIERWEFGESWGYRDIKGNNRQHFEEGLCVWSGTPTSLEISNVCVCVWYKRELVTCNMACATTKSRQKKVNQVGWGVVCYIGKRILFWLEKMRTFFLRLSI